MKCVDDFRLRLGTSPARDETLVPPFAILRRQIFDDEGHAAGHTRATLLARCEFNASAIGRYPGHPKSFFNCPGVSE